MLQSTASKRLKTMSVQPIRKRNEGNLIVGDATAYRGNERNIMLTRKIECFLGSLHSARMIIDQAWKLVDFSDLISPETKS